MKHRVFCLAVAFMASGVSHATIVGFGQLGGSNAPVPKALASRATSDGNGFVVSNGVTPNISLNWDINGENQNGNPNSNGWDIHTSDFFAELEDQTIGGGDWDNEGPDQRIGQLDFDYHSIGFLVDRGAALVLNSFDFANTAETSDSTVWDLSITDSSSAVVWSQQVTLTNPDSDTITVTPNFTGNIGESYTLVFDAVGDPIDGRHGIDNLSFNQTPDFSSPVGALVINRSGPNAGTGYIRADQAFAFSEYEIVSTAGALNPQGWSSIADSDADPNDEWTIVNETATILGEKDGPGGINDGMSLGAGAQYNLGQAFSILPLFFRDGTTPTNWDAGSVSVFAQDGTLLPVLPEFVGDPVPWGDYNGDLQVNAQDWPLFRAGLGGDYTGMTAAQAYLGGDLDGDLDSDVFDYKIFVELAGGATALFGASQVPEPSSMVLFGLAGLAVCMGRRLRTVCALLVVVATIAVGSNAQAQTLQNFSVVGSTPTVSIPEGQLNEGENAGPDQWFDDTILDEPNHIPFDLFYTNYTDADLFPGGFLGQYAIGGEMPGVADSAVVFMDYGTQVTADWFAYAQRTGGNAVADKVGKFELWFSNTNFNGVVPTTTPDAVVNLLPSDNRISDSVIRPYTLEGSHSGQYVAVRITETAASGALTSTSRIGGHEFRLLDGPSDVVLTIDRASGELTLRNNLAGAENIFMDSYSIESPGGALVPGSFDGLQGDAMFTAGNGSGNGWELAEGITSGRLVETFYTGQTTFTAGTGPLSLGDAYNNLSGIEDLVFLWTNKQGEVYNARVEYINEAPGVAGDYNGDGVVNLADYTVWRNNLGAAAGTLPNDGSGEPIGSTQYETWKSNFGMGVSPVAGLSTASVPEPGATLLVLAAAVPAVLLRRLYAVSRN